MAEAYIVAAARTAGGRRDGKLKEWHPADLAGMSSTHCWTVRALHRKWSKT
jgi:acetyl-CoA acetyltransferase